MQKGVTRHEINVDSGCLVTGSKTRVPHGLWYNLFHKEGVETMEQGNRVEAKFIPIKDIAGPKSEFLGSLSHAAAVSGKYATFENEIVKTVIQHKWETYVRRMFMKSLFLDIAMVIFLTADVLFHGSGSDDGTLGENLLCASNRVGCFKEEVLTSPPFRNYRLVPHDSDAPPLDVLCP